MDLINTLPDEILDRLFHHLEAKDLGRTSLVCRRFNTLAISELHWKSLCKIDWSVTELPDEIQSWKTAYLVMHNRFGPYLKCYNRVNQCWQKIFDITQSRAPVIYTSLLRDGTSEEVLNNVQRGLGEYAYLPMEYRCSYLLCNGQMIPRAITAVDWSFAGLFGAYEEEDYGDYFCTWTNDYAGGPQVGPFWHSNQTIFRHCCLSLIWVVKRTVPPMATHGGVALCIRDVQSSPHRASCSHNDEHEALDGRMVSIGSVGNVNGNGIEFFVYSNSFIEYLEAFADKAAIYPVVNDRFLKYDFNSESYTGPYGVTVRTAFFRERSTAFPNDEREFHFFYRITMSMKSDAPKCDTCQLETRHWIITNASGEVTTVNGPGVVGNYPVMRPGGVYTWISRTSYSTTSGTMHGHFTMKRIGSGNEVRIECPVYKMVAPAFVLG